jgi:hypothetical protein
MILDRNYRAETKKLSRGSEQAKMLSVAVCQRGKKLITIRRLLWEAGYMCIKADDGSYHAVKTENPM